jgi:putative redox protein
MSTVKVWHEQGKLRQELSVGRHRLVADVTTDLGGEDTGPSPHDYLAAALASCTAITMRMYAQRKSWPLENAEVVVTVDQSADTTKFERKIRLIGALSEEQLTRIREIADRCPIHKALEGKIEIHTEHLS